MEGITYYLVLFGQNFCKTGKKSFFGGGWGGFKRLNHEFAKVLLVLLQVLIRALFIPGLLEVI